MGRPHQRATQARPGRKARKARTAPAIAEAFRSPAMREVPAPVHGRASQHHRRRHSGYTSGTYSGHLRRYGAAGVRQPMFRVT